MDGRIMSMKNSNDRGYVMSFILFIKVVSGGVSADNTTGCQHQTPASLMLSFCN